MAGQDKEANIPQRPALDYQLCADHSPQHAHLHFPARFNEEPVIWDCHIYPLLNQDIDLLDSQCTHQFIDISQQKNNKYRRIDIGLNVITVTEPTILKTIIMIRQYKNLHAGRHEWK